MRFRFLTNIISGGMAFMIALAITSAPSARSGLATSTELSMIGNDRITVVNTRQRHATCVHIYGYHKKLAAGHIQDHDTADHCHDTHKCIVFSSVFSSFLKQTFSLIPGAEFSEHFSSRLERPPQS